MKVTNLTRKIAKKLGAVAVGGSMLLPGVAILAGGLSFVGEAGAAQLVVNGNFEAGPPLKHGNNSGLGWTTVQGNDLTKGFNVYSHATEAYYAGPAPAGSGAFYFHTVRLGALSGTVGGQPAIPAIVEQVVNTTGLAGQTYTFSAYIAGYPIPNDTATLELSFWNAAGGVSGGGTQLGSTALLDGKTGGADGLTQTWDLFTQVGLVPAGALSASVRIFQATNGTSNGNDNYVDLVSLEVIPEPGSLALLGMGGVVLAGLGRSRRK